MSRLTTTPKSSTSRLAALSIGVAAMIGSLAFASTSAAAVPASTYRANDNAELAGDMVAGLLSERARPGMLNDRLDVAWRSAFLPSYRETAARISALDKETAEVEAATPRTMVMKELPQARPGCGRSSRGRRSTATA